MQCAREVEELRQSYAHPLCFACLPPPAPLEPLRPGDVPSPGHIVAAMSGGAPLPEDGAIRGTITNGTAEPIAPRVVVQLRTDGTYPDAPDDCAACGEPAHVGVACSLPTPPRAVAPRSRQFLFVEGGKAPPIVTLCGSTRFRRAFEEATYRLTLEGWAVLSLACFGREETRGRDGLTPRQKEELDALHLKKVAMSKRVHVLNVGGYIGESTTREIAHAFALKIAITFAEEKAGNAWLEEHAHELGELIAGRLSSAGGGLVAPSPRPKKPHPFGRRFSK